MKFKAEFAHAMATLLCLNHNMEADLMKLEDATLHKMYNSYIQNAKDSNHLLEQTANACKQEPTTRRYKNTNKGKR